MPRTSQDGLEWTETLFDLVPQWTRDISITAIETICRQQLAISPDDPCTITFHASGLFNKLYLVRYTGDPLLMRVSLPVYPRHKTRAEVATLQWVDENTKVPVPDVFSYDDSNDNEIGFEWILMEFKQGTSAYKRWRTMSMEQKASLTREIATFQVELSGIEQPGSRFTSIGTLEPQDATHHDAEAPTKVVPGQLVSHEFFMGHHLHYDIPRGPFRSSHDWLSTVLNIIILHQTAVLRTSEDEDEKEDAESTLSVARKLLSLLPKVFPPIVDEPETTGLYHHDLHLKNILVNDEGEITAILDWECVSALPPWMFTLVPQFFLEEEVREEEPQRDIYMDETPEEATAQAEKRNDPDYLDNEGKNSLYFIHRMEYEATQLRKVYEAKLREHWPDWPHEESHVKADFFRAVSLCDGLLMGKVHIWADRMEKGEIVRFKDV